MADKAREAVRAGKTVVSSIFGEYAAVLRIAALMVAPMLLAATVGYILAAKHPWPESAVGLGLGVAMLAALSYWVYRPWRVWGGGLRLVFVLLQLLTLIATIGAGAAIYKRARNETCSTLYECVSTSVQQFWSEAND